MPGLVLAREEHSSLTPNSRAARCFHLTSPISAENLSADRIADIDLVRRMAVLCGISFSPSDMDGRSEWQVCRTSRHHQDKPRAHNASFVYSRPFSGVVEEIELEL
jgi:hypothetical protein